MANGNFPQIIAKLQKIAKELLQKLQKLIQKINLCKRCFATSAVVSQKNQVKPTIATFYTCKFVLQVILSIIDHPRLDFWTSVEFLFVSLNHMSIFLFCSGSRDEGNSDRQQLKDDGNQWDGIPNQRCM